MRTRNIYGGLLMAAAALLCLAGCKKDEEGEKITLGTQFEKAVSAQKTCLGEGNTVCWSAGDEVTVNAETVTVSDGSVNVTKAEHYYAVYPAEGNSVNATGGEVTIPASQTYTLDEQSGKQVLAGPMAARLDEASGMLYFKNLYSLLKVTVCADEKAFTVNSITVTGTGSLAGTYSFGFNGATTTEASTAPTVGEITSGSNKVTLNCSSVEVAANTDKDFYLVAHPMAAQKLTVKVSGMLDGNSVAYTHTTATTVGLSRSRIGGLGINLQQLEPEVDYNDNFKFTVNSNGQQVTFAPGNLQWSAINGGTWRFAEHQWDYVGDATNGTVYAGSVKCNNKLIAADYTGWIDLFAWGTSGNNHGAISYQPWANDGMSNVNYNAYGAWDKDLTYGNSSADWGYGKTLNGSSGWRTLSYDEWNYVLFERTIANSLYSVGNVNGVNGVILLPDDWILPEGGSFTAHASTSSVNVYTLEQWIVMESAGAVFLPAAGSRDANTTPDVTNVNVFGWYWSTTHSGQTAPHGALQNAYYAAGGLAFVASSFDVVENVFTDTRNDRSDGFSVRLVKDVK